MLGPLPTALLRLQAISRHEERIRSESVKVLTTTPQPPQPRARARTRAWRSQQLALSMQVLTATRAWRSHVSAELVHLHRLHR